MRSAYVFIIVAFAVLGALFAVWDWLMDSAVWVSPFWLEFEGWIIGASVLLAFALGLWLSSRSQKKYSAELEQLSRTRNWTFSRKDGRELYKVVEALIPNTGVSLRNLRTIRSNGTTAIVFDCSLRNPNRERHDRFATGCLLESSAFDRLHSPVEIFPPMVLDKVFLTNQIRLDDERFSQEFVLIGTDAMNTHVIMNRRVRELLLEYRENHREDSVTAYFGKRGIVVLSGTLGYIREEQRWLDMVALAASIISATTTS